MKKSVDWRVFFILLGLSIVSIICVIPYLITVQGETLKQIGQPLEIIFLAQLLQSLILFSVAIYFGLRFTKKIGFKLPLIEAFLEKGNVKKVLGTFLWQSLFLGIAVALAIYALDSLFTLQGVDISTHTTYAPAWQTILAAFYGGIAEEVLLRLFVMTFLIWIGMKLFRKAQPTNTIIITSIIVAAVLFGLGHLPLTATLTTITPFVVVRAVVLNGVGGIVFGWLFWKKGLESAILAHFTTDVVLLTLLPVL